MVCSIVYYIQGKSAPNIKTCTSIEDAKKTIIESENNSYSDQKLLNAQILVDYSNVQMYKEKFDELYEIMKNNMFPINKKEEI